MWLVLKNTQQPDSDFSINGTKKKKKEKYPLLKLV